MFSLATLGDNNNSLLTLEQKKAILLFLYMIMMSAFQKEDREPKLQFIDQCTEDFEVIPLDCVPYLDDVGGIGVFRALKSLPDLQKEFLMLLTFQYANCNGAPTENELVVIWKYLKKVDFNENILLQALYKTQAIDKLISH